MTQDQRRKQYLLHTLCRKQISNKNEPAFQELLGSRVPGQLSTDNVASACTQADN